MLSTCYCLLSTEVHTLGIWCRTHLIHLTINQSLKPCPESYYPSSYFLPPFGPTVSLLALAVSLPCLDYPSSYFLSSLRLHLFALAVSLLVNSVSLLAFTASLLGLT